MYKIVEEYFAAVEKIDAERDKRNEAERATLNDSRTNPNTAARQAASDLYYRRADAINAIHTAQRAAAWAVLGLSDDKAVRWIAANCRNYVSHAEAVMKILPADIKTLRQLRVDEGWCSDFTALLKSAVRAGAVQDDRSTERTAMENWVERNIGASYIGQVTTLVDAVLAAEAADYVENAEDDDEDDEDD